MLRLVEEKWFRNLLLGEGAVVLVVVLRGAGSCEWSTK